MKEPSNVPCKSKAEEHISVGMEDDRRNPLPSSPVENLRQVLPQSNLKALSKQLRLLRSMETIPLRHTA